MKKLMICLAAILSAASLMAQPGRMPGLPPGFIPARTGETTVKKQSTYTPDFKVDGKNTKINNVILLIGDGMGVGAVGAAMYANGGELTMTNLRTFGYVRTQSADDFTTDSAASGTAWATGIKTNNGYVGRDPNKNDIPNIPEKIAALGYACGVISTDDLSGATPAAFFAHQTAREASAGIWADLANSCLTFASAGTMSMYNAQIPATKAAISSKFTIVNTMKSPLVANSKRLVYLPASVQYNERGNYLPETTEAAIEYLAARGKKGFFLMVEGARIDKESHGNNFPGTVRETLDFDKAVEAAIRFAEKDGHTLVIISADHETGAVALTKGRPEEGYIAGSYASGGHSPIMVPLFAYGPHSKDFACFQENSDVSNKIVKLLMK